MEQQNSLLQALPVGRLSVQALVDAAWLALALEPESTLYAQPRREMTFSSNPKVPSLHFECLSLHSEMVSFSGLQLGARSVATEASRSSASSKRLLPNYLFSMASCTGKSLPPACSRGFLSIGPFPFVSI